MSDLSVPALRARLLWHLDKLSDRKYQEDAWIGGRYLPGAEFDGFDAAVDFFYDATALAEDPDGAVGRYLRDDAEVAAIRRLATVLDRLLAGVGRGRTDAEYLAAPEWDEVVEAAGRAYRVLRENDEGARPGS